MAGASNPVEVTGGLDLVPLGWLARVLRVDEAGIRELVGKLEVPVLTVGDCSYVADLELEMAIAKVMCPSVQRPELSGILAMRRALKEMSSREEVWAMMEAHIEAQKRELRRKVSGYEDQYT